jgi:hypothetical protein
MSPATHRRAATPSQKTRTRCMHSPHRSGPRPALSNILSLRLPIPDPATPLPRSYRSEFGRCPTRHRQLFCNLPRLVATPRSVDSSNQPNLGWEVSISRGSIRCSVFTSVTRMADGARFLWAASRAVAVAPCAGPLNNPITPNNQPQKFAICRMRLWSRLAAFPSNPFGAVFDHR